MSTLLELLRSVRNEFYFCIAENKKIMGEKVINKQGNIVTYNQNFFLEKDNFDISDYYLRTIRKKAYSSKENCMAIVH